MSTTSLIVHALVAIVLIFLGTLLFRERLSAINFIGILLCLVGIFLMQYKSF